MPVVGYDPQGVLEQTSVAIAAEDLKHGRKSIIANQGGMSRFTHERWKKRNTWSKVIRSGVPRLPEQYCFSQIITNVFCIGFTRH